MNLRHDRAWQWLFIFKLNSNRFCLLSWHNSFFHEIKPSLSNWEYPSVEASTHPSMENLMFIFLLWYFLHFQSIIQNFSFFSLKAVASQDCPSKCYWSLQCITFALFKVTGLMPIFLDVLNSWIQKLTFLGLKHN